MTLTNNLRTIAMIFLATVLEVLLIITVPSSIVGLPPGLSRTLLSLTPLYFAITMIIIIYQVHKSPEVKE